ncbi:hypothetical protein [Pseudomonas sp. B14(2017)]|uniref:hypothetical protein n=1 Tax=Pseudomonas sp. B14(2017) TaxID=1981745 RepID=UPI000A1FCC4F|nr:hypothetical protein [Pseudomonas sp. B14(2017)]
MHVLTRAAVAIPALDKYHPDLLPHLDTYKVLGDLAQERNGLNHTDFRPVRKEWCDALSAIKEYGPTRGGVPFTSGVYSIPFLHPKYCDDLLTEIAAMSFAVNEDEEAEVQIPEITLADNCPSLHSCLHGLFNKAVNPLTQVLYQLEQERMSSIQFAQYRPDNTAKGHWHHDRDSDITLVVALSDFHKGGGTLVKPQGLGEPFEVPQLPVGHGMLFQGSRTLHMGLPVTEGARNLLVFWSEIK